MTHLSEYYTIIIMGIKCSGDPFNMGMVYFTKGVLHNGCIFSPPTHTSGHFILESPPPPPPPDLCLGTVTMETKLGIR